MKNTSKLIPIFILSVSLLGGCSTSEVPPIINNENVLVESISFDILDEKIYVNHYGKIQNFAIYPKNVSNNDVKWYLEDSTLGEIIDDKIYAKEVGTTNVVCEALDGSNASYKQEITIIPLLTPTSMDVETDIITTIGCPYTPKVTFYPYSTTTDQRYVLSVPSEYEQYVSIVDNKIIGLKAGNVSVKVASFGNPNNYKYIKILFEDDLIASSEVLPGYSATLEKYYEDRTSVVKFEKEFDTEPRWPEIKIKLPYPVSLLNKTISFDLKWLGGCSWGSMKFLDENNNSVVTTPTGGEFEAGFNADLIGEWKKISINLDDRFTREVSYIKFHVYSCYYEYKPEGEPSITYPGDKVSFLYDNLAVYDA